MKYYIHWKINREDLDKVIDRFMKAEKRSDPENYPKPLSPTYYFHNKFEGFMLVEVEREEQIINYNIYYHDVMETVFKSIGESIDFIKAYKK